MEVGAEGMVLVVEGGIEGEWTELVELVLFWGFIHLRNVKFMLVSYWSQRLRETITLVA